MKTTLNRREAMRLGAAVVAVGTHSVAQPVRRQRVLILGGTGFIGPHFVGALRGAGHEITLFNRGKSGRDLNLRVATLIGDRNGQIEALRNRYWDVVIDNSGYVPRHVRLTAEALREHANHY